MSLNHAKHNEELCKKLYHEKHFFDWVITTAFYSALHYSESKLFPMQYGSVIYYSFDRYYQAFKMQNDNKHNARKRLIYSNVHVSAGAAYSWLKDYCWNARYYNYQINEIEAATAILKLDILISYLTKQTVLKRSTIN